MQPTDPDARNPSLLLYIAGAAAQIAGLAAVSYQLGEPTFAYFTVVLTLVGAAVSYQLRRLGTNPRLIKSGALLLGLVFLYAYRAAGLFGSIVPVEAQGSQEMLLVCALALTATFWSFLWLTDEAVVFTCVWSIAMIGLTGTVNINRELILSFIAFLGAATFLLVHHNALLQSRAPSGETNPASHRPSTSLNLLRTQFAMALVAWLGSILLGFLVAIPVQMVGRNLSLATIIQRLKVPPSPTGRTPGRPRLIFDNLMEFKVGIGPVDDDPTERMQVLSEGPHYWRGRVYDLYNGHSWTSTFGAGGQDKFAEDGQDTPDGLSTFNLAPLGKPRNGVAHVTHHYRINAGVYGPLYACAEPRRVRAPVLHIIQRDDNTIGTGRGMGTEYEVDSDVVDPKASDLRNSGTVYPPEIAENYMNQGTTNDALQQLMLEATAGAPTNPYDRTQHIRRFIANRCIYTREARAVPTDRDAAEFFLNESKEGYCDLYATAMTVLCRYAGLPARVATGFAPGSVATDMTNLPPINPKDKRKWYVLRGSDLHAWTEVYFVGYGWLPFDATSDTSATVVPTKTPEPVKKANRWEAFLKQNGIPLVLCVLGLCGMLFVAFNELSGRIGARLPGRRGMARADEVARIYKASLRRVAKRGGRRPVTMTPSEYVAQVREAIDASVAVPLSTLTSIAERSLYGPDEITNEDVAAARGARDAVLTALRAAPRRKPDAAVPA
jgi:transglutaminase-like putative cysteine protease